MSYLDKLQITTGIDVPVPELKFTLKQPKIKDIAVLGETKYFLALSIFKMSKESLKIPSEDITNWEIFKESITQEIPDVENTSSLITNFLQLFSLDKIAIGPRSLMIIKGTEIGNIEPEDFDLFREIVLEVGGGSLLTGGGEEEFRPGNDRAAQIAEKMKKARAKVAAQRAAENPSSSFLSKYVRAVVTVTSNSFTDVNNMTISQLNDILQTYLLWEAYDLDVKSRLAGGKSDNKLEHWMAKSIEQEDSSIETVVC